MATELATKTAAMLQRSQSLQVDDDRNSLPKSCIWDWPFCDEGVAKCVVTKEKFTVCLEFNSAKGERFCTAKKFDQIKESNFSWSLGLSSADNGTSFWKVNIEILRNLNMIAIEAFRDISRLNERGKTLRRVRKVYRLPDQFDIATLQTSSFGSGSITLEVFPRTETPKSSVAHRRLVNGHHLKRSGSAVVGD
uniref:Uncharacterized protein n=1 Tax=Plectus sambesii TaxID=2011161 RepID=A0A914VGL3_9BILA